MRQNLSSSICFFFTLIVSLMTYVCVSGGKKWFFFRKNLACFVFLKHPFWDSLFCFITDCYKYRKFRVVFRTQSNFVILEPMEILTCIARISQRRSSLLSSVKPKRQEALGTGFLFIQSYAFCKGLWCGNRSCYLHLRPLNTLQRDTSIWKQSWSTSLLVSL